MKRTIAVVSFVLAFAALALAHGNEKHVMGTITNISGNTITVQTTSKQSVSVGVSDQTKIEKSGSAAALTDLKIGDKVVIHAAKKGDKLIATKISFGVMKGSMAGMSHKHGATEPHDHQ